MPFTLFHALASFSAARIVTKDKLLLALAFAGGLAPDLDGAFILFNTDLFYKLHHELLHPPAMGILAGLIVAVACAKLLKLDAKKAFAFFTGGYFLHLLADLLLTNWPIKLLWPLSQAQHSFPELIGYNAEFAIATTLAAAAAIVSLLLEKRPGGKAHSN
jgi:membrane-bound metal-dependent hydrolase YbcI (DUF457 family)